MKSRCDACVARVFEYSHEEKNVNHHNVLFQISAHIAARLATRASYARNASLLAKPWAETGRVPWPGEGQGAGLMCND